MRNTFSITTAFVALSLIAGSSVHAGDVATGMRSTATDAAFGKSKRGFMLIPQPYTVKSPVFDGAGEPVGEEQQTAVRAHVELIQVKDTPWVRIRFGQHNLGAESYMILTSLDDGDRQRLDSWSMPIWQNTSAVFNGTEVEIALFVAPRDKGVFFTVDEVLVADPEDFAFGTDTVPLPNNTASLCDDGDDRVPSNDSRVGRLFFGGCTGWLVHNGAVLTAGHCGEPDGNITGVLEFNVPASSPNGVTRSAGTNDQYPVTGVVSSESNGEGADYAVFAVGPNSNTGLRAHIAQGFFHMTALIPSEGRTLRVTGYGLDWSPAGPGGPGAPCCDYDSDEDCDYNCNSANCTQQTATGSCDDCLVDYAIEHTVDTAPANSGSPIIWESTGLAIGIHTQGGCDSFWSDYDNAGTWLMYPPLASAMNGFLGPNVWWVDGASPNPIQFGHVLYPFNRVSAAVVSAPDGATVAIVAGDYPAALGNTFVAGADGRAMTLTAHVGMVRIGN